MGPLLCGLMAERETALLLYVQPVGLNASRLVNFGLHLSRYWAKSYGILKKMKDERELKYVALMKCFLSMYVNTELSHGEHM